MVRVLVTGSNGSLGRVACTALQQAGHWVRGLDRAAGSGDSTYDRSATPDAQPDDFVQAEITDAAALAAAMESIDVVIHLAATPDDLATFDEPGGIMVSTHPRPKPPPTLDYMYRTREAASAAGETSGKPARTCSRLPEQFRAAVPQPCRS